MRVHPELAAEAGLLEAAERRRHAHRRVRVDREDAGLDRADDAHRARRRRASRPSRRARTACRWRSGPPPPRRRTGSRRRPARRPPRARRGRRSSPRRAWAGTRSPRPSGASPWKSTSPSTNDGDLLALLRGDQRAHLGRVVLGVADAHAARRADEQLDEAVVGGALDEDARARAAVLAGVAEDGVGRARRPPRSRSASAKTTFADLPPSSSVTRLIVAAAPRMTARPDLGRAGEADLRHVGVLDEPLRRRPSPCRRRR